MTNKRVIRERERERDKKIGSEKEIKREEKR